MTLKRLYFKEKDKMGSFIIHQDFLKGRAEPGDHAQTCGFCLISISQSLLNPVPSATDLVWVPLCQRSRQPGVPGLPIYSSPSSNAHSLPLF